MSDDKNDRQTPSREPEPKTAGTPGEQPYSSNEADPAAGPADRKPDPSIQPT